jgi:hypothetical protein
MNFTPTEVVGAITSAIGVASVLAAFLPQGKPGSVWANVRVVIDTLAQNYGNATNAKKV